MQVAVCGLLLTASCQLQAECDFCSLRLPYPRALGLFYFLTPRQVLEPGEEPTGIVGDLQEPLCEPFLFDLGAATLATTINHLLIRKYGLVFGAPLHGCELPLGEAVLEKLREEPLRPLVILRLAGDGLFAPVKRRAHRRELFAHARHIRIRPCSRIFAVLHRRVLGGQSERVEPDREEHILAAQTEQARIDVSDREGVPVANMEIARRVRELYEQIVRLFGLIREICCIEVRTNPFLPCFFFNVFMVVCHPYFNGG